MPHPLLESHEKNIESILITFASALIMFSEQNFLTFPILKGGYYSTDRFLFTHVSLSFPDTLAWASQQVIKRKLFLKFFRFKELSAFGSFCQCKIVLTFLTPRALVRGWSHMLSPDSVFFVIVLSCWLTGNSTRHD